MVQNRVKKTQVNITTLNRPCANHAQRIFRFAYVNVRKECIGMIIEHFSQNPWFDTYRLYDDSGKLLGYMSMPR
jgi:hypothetical protein